MAGENWLTGWGHRKQITISNTNVDADIASFPVYVPIVSDTDIGGVCESDGGDIRFTTSDGSTELSYEKVYFAVATGAANGDFYVLVNPVDHDANTLIYCYYDKNSQTTSSAPATVFNTTNGWVGVWHLEEDISSTVALDATSNDNDSVGTSMQKPERVSGLSGYAQDFDSTNSEGIKIADSASLDIGTSDITISCWSKRESSASIMYLFSHQDTDASEGYILFGSNSNPSYARFIIEDADAASYCSTATSLADGSWCHVAVTVDRDNSDGMVPYINGTAGTDSDPTGAADTIASTNFFYIGCDYGTGNFWNGLIDEVRISNIVRSAAWMKFEYKNMEEGHAAGNELTWAAEEDASVEEEAAGAIAGATGVAGALTVTSNVSYEDLAGVVAAQSAIGNWY